MTKAKSNAHQDIDDALSSELGDFGKTSTAPALKSAGASVTAMPTQFQKKLQRAHQTTSVLPTGYHAIAPGFPGETELPEAHVPLELIDDNIFNARRIYKPHRITKMAQSITQSGQLQAGLAVAKGDRIMLIAGHYRKRGLLEAGKATMRLSMLPPDTSDQDLYLFSWFENEERDNQSPLDNALAWKDLLDKEIWPTDEALAISLGLHKSTISKTLSLLDLTAQARQQLESAETTPGISVLYAYRQYEATAYRLLDEKAADSATFEVLERILKEEITRDEINDRRKLIENPKHRKPKENSRQHKLRFKGRQIGVLKDWDDGRIVLDIKIADPAERTKLLEELRARYLPEN